MMLKLFLPLLLGGARHPITHNSPRLVAQRGGAGANGEPPPLKMD